MKKWAILIALQFRYTFYRPQNKRLRARKIGFGHPSGDVPCASEDCATTLKKAVYQTRIWLAAIEDKGDREGIPIYTLFHR